MYSNSPKVRGALYGAAVAAQVVAFFAADLSVGWAGACQSTANFLGALAGMTALGNLTTPADRRPEP